MNKKISMLVSFLMFGSNLFADIGTDFQQVICEMRAQRKSSPILYKTLITGSIVSLCWKTANIWKKFICFMRRPTCFFRNFI
jgi:hypothetical protein